MTTTYDHDQITTTDPTPHGHITTTYDYDQTTSDHGHTTTTYDRITTYTTVTVPRPNIHTTVMPTYPELDGPCLLYTSPSPRDATLSRMPSSA